MTSYEQGFLTKLAEMGASPYQAGKIFKVAQQAYWKDGTTGWGHNFFRGLGGAGGFVTNLYKNTADWGGRQGDRIGTWLGSGFNTPNWGQAMQEGFLGADPRALEEREQQWQERQNRRQQHLQQLQANATGPKLSQNTQPPAAGQPPAGQPPASQPPVAGQPAPAQPQPPAPTQPPPAPTGDRQLDNWNKELQETRARYAQQQKDREQQIADARAKRDAAQAKENEYMAQRRAQPAAPGTTPQTQTGGEGGQNGNWRNGVDYTTLNRQGQSNAARDAKRFPQKPQDQRLQDHWAQVNANKANGVQQPMSVYDKSNNAPVWSGYKGPRNLNPPPPKLPTRRMV